MEEKRRYLTRDEMNSSVYRLFNTPFVVRVAYIDLIDIGEIQRYGMITSGDEHDDRCNAHEKVTVALKIPKLLELFRKQIPFYLVDSSHEHLMYTIIHEHLIEWREYVEECRGINHLLGKVPYKDLRDLSEMATVIYKVRDRNNDRDITETINAINQSFSVTGVYTGYDLFTREKEKTDLIEEMRNQQELAPHLADMGKISEKVRG